MELKVPPLAVWAALAAASAALAQFFPAASVPFPGHRTIAVVAILLGLGIAVAGVVEFRRARTTVNPLSPHKSTSVVTTGIYRFTRNPMYVGMAMALAGIAAWPANVLGLLLVPVFCLYMTRFQIQPEERALLARFGDEFFDYMSRVRRWL